MQQTAADIVFTDDIAGDLFCPQALERRAHHAAEDHIGTERRHRDLRLIDVIGRGKRLGDRRLDRLATRSLGHETVVIKTRIADYHG